MNGATAVYERCVSIEGAPADEWYSDGLGTAQGAILSPFLFILTSRTC
jgi:hypothetical protein